MSQQIDEYAAIKNKKWRVLFDLDLTFEDIIVTGYTKKRKNYSKITRLLPGASITCANHVSVHRKFASMAMKPSLIRISK